MRTRANLLAVLLIAAAAAQQPVDPGPRPGPSAAGAPLPGLTAAELAYFNQGLEAFQEQDDVKRGLGPSYNLDSCSGCHAQPAIGGTSPALNPQIAAATRAGAANRVPSFLSDSGPVRVARFVNIPGTNRPDGGVHDLFTIAGRSDAAGCSLAQPDFNAASAARNVVFRIPTPVFGAGLMEAIPDANILANLAADGARKRALGITGKVNTNGNDGTITRFGWKAQNVSLLLFSGEAYNVEVGVTNDLFPTEHNAIPGCVFNATPEDRMHAEATLATDAFSDIQLFTFFMRFLAPPTPAAPTPEIHRGQALFSSVGCGACHTPLLMTGQSATSALNNQPVPLYSDLLLHNMGPGLADGITQGAAGGNEWRTAPLWGLGQRLFFLHDGRARTLDEAIRAHASGGANRPPAGGPPPQPGNSSEANAVIAAYQSLPPNQQQDLLRFLRSL